MRNLLNKLRNIDTTIALATLIVTSIGVFVGVQIFSNNQSVTGENGCTVDDIMQEATSGANSKQNVACKNNSTITGVTQK